MSTQMVAFKTLLRREIKRILRIWPQTILPSPISMLLYFLIFGSLIGRRVGMVDGFNYVEYIAPGLIMMAVINNAYSNVVGSFYGSRFQRNIEEMFVSPMSSLTILLGFVFGGVFRAIIVGSIVTLVALFFIDITIHSWLITLAVVGLTAMLFSLAGIINGVFAQSFDDITIVPTFVLTPLTYLGGVFYSINMLPDFWRNLSYANPILYVINAFRHGMLGVSDIHIGVTLTFIFCLVIFLFGWATYLLVKGIGIRN